MAILPIYITGDPILATPTEPVTEFNEELEQLVEDMYETTVAAPGVGLAGPQVGLGKSLFVWVYDEQDEAPSRGAAINPELWIEPIDPSRDEPQDEGCLSFPDVYYPLARSPRAILRAQDVHGDHYEINASGWFARILQHEYDHLTGHLYIDRLAPRDLAAAKKHRREQGWTKKHNTWTPEPR